MHTSPLSRALTLLNTHPEASLKLQGMLRTHDCTTLLFDESHAPPQAVLIRARRGFWSMFADPDRPEALKLLLDQIDWSRSIDWAGVWEPLLPYITERADLAWSNPCIQAHLYPTADTRAALLQHRGPDDAGLARPRPEHAPLILDHWPYGSSDDPGALKHIQERLEHAAVSGWFEGDRLVSWAMTHPDTSLGFMHTREAYRRRGIGHRVAADLILKVIDRGWTPFCHVVEANTAPLGMLKRLGFTPTKERYFWLSTRG
ncbi:MAG: GNAT family N-acetyltransferase [Myxococcota bacterium]